MNFSLKTANNWHQLSCDCLVIPLVDDKKLSAKLKDLDAQQQGRISALLKSGDIKASKESISLIHSIDNKGPRLLFLGLGSKPSFANLRQALNQTLGQLKKADLKSAAVLLDGLEIDGISEQQLIQQSAELLLASSYQYDATLTKKAAKLSLTKVTLLCSATSAANKAALLQGQATGMGINSAKHLGNLPANFCTPSYIAEQAQGLAKAHPSLTCKVLNEAQMKKLNMHSLLSVTEGTDEPAKFIILQYSGAKKASDKPYVLVGKGVTFDSGGISLKPGVGMDEMKYDMCGAASVFGTMEAIVTLKAPINLIGVIAAVENMPSGRATKPGDVITSMAGKTIEVLNTDAEGRLVLCDALTYVERFKPKAVIDIATLTGAAIVALGKHASALYSNRPELSLALVSAGEKTYDRAWPMPLWEEYNQQLSSNFADIANIGGPQGGSVTAACFLSRFTEAYPWAHLDIAGPAWLNGAQKGATGRPVSLLVQYLLDQC